jgi:hypothetical protein
MYLGRKERIVMASKVENMPLTVKCRTVQQAYEGGKMGWDVPQSTVDFFTDVRRPAIRSSPLSSLDHCPREFLYAYRLGIRPRQYEAALTMGTIVHKVLQCLFLGQKPEEALEVCERVLQKEQQALLDIVGPDGLLPSGVALEPLLQKVEEDYHKARAMALVFWQFVPFDPNEYEILRTPEGEPCVELLLTCRYPGLSRPIITPCDLALVHKTTGFVWIVDHKTTSFDPKKRAIPTKISAQLALYRLGLQAHLDDWADKGLAEKQTVIGSLHAILRKPTIKYCPKTKDKAGFSAYIERMIQWYKDQDEKDPNNPPLILDPNRFSTKVMPPELWGRLKQFCKASYCSPNVHHFYRVGESGCLQYNRICPYMQLCNSHPAMWPDIIRDRFEISYREDKENES